MQQTLNYYDLLSVNELHLHTIGWFFKIKIITRKLVLTHNVRDFHLLHISAYSLGLICMPSFVDYNTWKEMENFYQLTICTLVSRHDIIFLVNKLNMYSFEESFHRYLMAMGWASERVTKGAIAFLVWSAARGDWDEESQENIRY